VRPCAKRLLRPQFGQRLRSPRTMIWPRGTGKCSATFRAERGCRPVAIRVHAVFRMASSWPS